MNEPVKVIKRSNLKHIENYGQAQETLLFIFLKAEGSSGFGKHLGSYHFNLFFGR